MSTVSHNSYYVLLWSTICAMNSFIVECYFTDNGGDATSRRDWVLYVRTVTDVTGTDGDFAILHELKVQVVATPGRKTKRNGPVAGPSSGNPINARAVENVRVRPNFK